MDIRKAVSSFEELYVSERKDCVKCGETRDIPKINVRCDECEAQILAEESARADRDSWKIQRIPARFWDFPVTDDHRKDARSSLYLYGDIGTGKTHYASQILKVSRGVFFTAVEMVDMCMENSGKINEFKMLGSMCIDDMAKINPTDYRIEKLFEIVDFRYRERRHTIITCDTTLPEIAEIMGKSGQALRSRIIEWMAKRQLTRQWR